MLPDPARDYLVITYDRRGYGRSAHKPVRDHRLHARDLIAILEQVAREPAVVVGWSSGGNVALAVAASRRKRTCAAIPGRCWPSGTRTRSG